jgi:uncharacterized damage-inducible protein DinB
MSTSGLSEFFHHNLWANMRLLDACSQLTDKQLDATTVGIYGSIRETLMHLFDAEEGYTRRFSFTGVAPKPSLREFTEFAGIDELRRRAEHSGKELIAMSEQADVRQVLHLDDGTYDAQVIIVLLQAINHGVDHRSQIATLMSQQGITPPILDAWGYNDDVYLS